MNVDKALEHLKRFDRKERGYLVRLMLGIDKFTLGAKIKEAIEKEFDIKIPDDHFCAMDYHLDWIYASLFLSTTDEKEPYEMPKTEGRITATQEDIDWLIVYKNDETTLQFILVEAKGDSYFGNAQMNSKIDRFKAIFEDFKNNVLWELLLISPKKPTKALDTSNVKYAWIEMPMNDIQKITRIDRTDEKNKYKHWKLEQKNKSTKLPS